MKSLQIVKYQQEYDRSQGPGLDVDLKVKCHDRDSFNSLMKAISNNDGKVFVTSEELPSSNTNKLDFVIESVSNVHDLTAASSYKAMTVSFYCIGRAAETLRKELMNAGKLSIPVSDELFKLYKAKSGEAPASLEIDWSDPKPNSSASLNQAMRLLEEARKTIYELEQKIKKSEARSKDLEQAALKAQTKQSEAESKLNDNKKETQLIDELSQILFQVLEERDLRETKYGSGKERFQLLEID